ncbi:MAG: site-specific integrase, partial [Oscillospiraceae bacterium]|nr:site-specific integrase [Oscillospiraceae bacterium]
MMTSTLDSFSSNLFDKEYSPVTVSKYLHDVSAFLSFAGNEPITKSLVLRWRQEISATHQVSSVNSMISAVNCWLTFLGLDSCRIKLLKTQPSPYCSETKILTIKEYNRLLEAAGKNTRLRLLIQTIATTGIRISELRFFTVEAVQR